ncbi:MAG TPA: hypothetical protein VHW90_00735, partial [Stellaceae bacterium]|nr:hypothetical protein [Stellaceae bacterium]
AAPRETRTRTPVAVMPPAAVTPPVAPAVAPLTPAELGAGICQCIADQTARRLSCMSSAEACQTTCGSHYAFVPHAVSCPIAGAEPQAK